jgi:hypothetical protein
MQQVQPLETTDGGQLPPSEGPGVRLGMSCMSKEQEEANAMNKHYVREDYDEPDVRPEERMLVEGWFIAAALLYAVGLVLAFVIGWYAGKVP